MTSKPLLTLTLITALLVHAPAFAQTKIEQAPPPVAEEKPLAPTINKNDGRPEGMPDIMEKPDQSWLDYRGYQPSEADLTRQHITNAEVLQWAQEATADVLSFTPESYFSQTLEAQRHFTPKGFEAYMNYLKSSGLENKISKDRFSASGVMNGNPIVTKSGAFGDAYRWLVKLPLLISFFEPSQQTENTAELAGNAKINLYIQITRVKANKKAAFNEDLKDHFIRIENWTVKAE
jgi:hypothetical protein